MKPGPWQCRKCYHVEDNYSAFDKGCPVCHKLNSPEDLGAFQNLDYPEPGEGKIIRKPKQGALRD